MDWLGIGSWTRYIKDLGGSLGFTQDQAGTVTILLTNLHGDVVAYAADVLERASIAAAVGLCLWGLSRALKTSMSIMVAA